MDLYFRVECVAKLVLAKMLSHNRRKTIDFGFCLGDPDPWLQCEFWSKRALHHADPLYKIQLKHGDLASFKTDRRSSWSDSMIEKLLKICILSKVFKSYA